MPVPMCGIIAASANAMNQARKREKMCNLKGDIAEVEALAQAYYDALDAKDKANAEEITQ